MDFALSEEQQAIREAIARICAQFSDDFWLAKDRAGEFPHELHQALARDGFGYAKECHVERYLRESLVGRIAPISPQLILCFIAEKVLGLPKSY